MKPTAKLEFRFFGVLMKGSSTLGVLLTWLFALAFLLAWRF